MIKERKRNTILKISSAVLALLFVCLVVPVCGQDCGDSENGKAQKLYLKGKDRKKYKKGERIQFLMKAVEIDPDFVGAHWELGYMRARTNRRRGKPYLKAAKHFEKVVANCPDFHSSAYFYLGEINYTEKNYKNAAIYFKKFLDFKSDDDKKFGKKYDEMLKIAKSAYKEAAFFADAYANPKPYNPRKVSPVSTMVDEYLPIMSPDNEWLYFTRRKQKEVNKRASAVSSSTVDYEERYSMASVSSSQAFSKGNPLPFPFNTNDNWNYGGASLTIDNKEMFLTICKPQNGKMNCDIYSTKKVNDTWTALKSVGPNVNTPEWEAQPTISKDGKTLMFASLRQGSKGIDIYYSNKQANGEWGPAQNIGAPINTDKHDKTPFFHSDSKTLYFSSKGHINFGGYDVFYAKMNKDGKWEEPVNIGHPINTKQDEHGYVVSMDGKTVYFASKQLKGKKTKEINIYAFDLYKEARPDEVIMVRGKVKDESGKPIQNAKVEIRNSKTNKVEKFKVDQSGEYTAMVTKEEGADFVVSVKAKDVTFNNFKLDGEGDKKQKLTMKVEKVKVGKPYKIDNIVFKTNSADLAEESKVTLRSFAGYLNDNDNINISIEGHTDNLGDEHRNLVLSTERAFSVLVYLQENGVHKDRLKFKGWGSKKPVASNASVDGRAQNRRTEFVITSN